MGGVSQFSSARHNALGRKMGSCNMGSPRPCACTAPASNYCSCSSDRNTDANTFHFSPPFFLLVQYLCENQPPEGPKLAVGALLVYCQDPRTKTMRSSRRTETITIRTYSTRSPSFRQSVLACPFESMILCAVKFSDGYTIL